MLIKLFSVIFFVFFDFDFYGLTWHHKCVWSWIWFQRHHELQFFFKCLDEFFSTQSAMYGCFKSFLSNVDFLHGHLYGCEVSINSIYGLNMVAKKGLWWSTRVSVLLTSYLVIHEY